MSRNNILYLLGAGRSGTTLLATILNSTSNITSYGELHQFYSYAKENKKCSCGYTIFDCPVWGKVINNLNLSNKEIAIFEATQNLEEKHKHIPLLLLGKKGSLEYRKSQEMLFSSICLNDGNWILDSSKYVGRFLLLNQLKNEKLKGIYVIRDIRGVIYSFSKKVQTTKKPLSTILYYLLINTFAQIVCWLNKDIIKLRYEDLVENPTQVVNHIYSYLLENSENNLVLNKSFEMPHIIGGNRLKINRSIKINKDEEWKHKLSRRKQIIYYILGFPFMLINNYKI